MTGRAAAARDQRWVRKALVAARQAAEADDFQKLLHIVGGMAFVIDHLILPERRHRGEVGDEEADRVDTLPEAAVPIEDEAAA